VAGKDGGRGMRKGFLFAIGALLLTAFIILNDLVDDWGRLSGGLENLTVFLQESMWPPNWSVLEAQSYPVCENNIIFVIVIGFGPLAGVLAMTFYTIGYLGKLQYETYEGMPSDSLEVSKAMGLSHPVIFTSVVIPETGNHLLSQLMFMFEYNVRHGTVIGIVGAGGIGYYISTYLKLLQYDKVLALLILIFIVVIIIDLLSLVLRSFVTDEGDVRKPKWLSFLMKYMDWSEGKQSTE
jgi:ABC-type amino acid transport system permease subunit